MQKTANYNLNQWEARDRVTRADFNADNAAIDAAIKSVADAASGGVTAVYGSYTGSGEAGSSNPNILTFSKRPLLVFVASSSFQAVFVQGASLSTSYYGANSGRSIIVRWADTTIRWYSSEAEAIDQLNVSGKTYYYVAILESA